MNLPEGSFGSMANFVICAQYSPDYFVYAIKCICLRCWRENSVRKKKLDGLFDMPFSQVLQSMNSTLTNELVKFRLVTQTQNKDLSLFIYPSFSREMEISGT